MSDYSRAVLLGTDGLLTVRAIPPDLLEVTVVGSDGATSWRISPGELQKLLDDLMLGILAEDFPDHHTGA